MALMHSPIPAYCNHGKFIFSYLKMYWFTSTNLFQIYLKLAAYLKFHALLWIIVSYRDHSTLKMDFHIEYKCKYASLNYYYKDCFHVYRCLLKINNTSTTSIAVYFFSSKFSRRLLRGFRVGFIKKFEIKYNECSHPPSLEIKHIECV